MSLGLGGVTVKIEVCTWQRNTAFAYNECRAMLIHKYLVACIHLLIHGRLVINGYRRLAITCRSGVMIGDSRVRSGNTGSGGESKGTRFLTKKGKSQDERTFPAAALYTSPQAPTCFDPLMPAPPVFTQEFFRPLATKWLTQVSLGDIDPEAIVKSVVDDGRVATSFPSPLRANSMFVFKKGCISGDPGTFPFSE